MSNTYDNLVKIGAIQYFKVDILVEAVRDLYYLAHIRKKLVERWEVKDSTAATDSTIRLVTELIDHGWCGLATWGSEMGSFENVTMSQDKLRSVIEDVNSNPFDFFLIATAKGESWVTRYEKLVDEL